MVYESVGSAEPHRNCGPYQDRFAVVLIEEVRRDLPNLVKNRLQQLAFIRVRKGFDRVHPSLLARAESPAEAFEQCWRRDWQDSEPHLLPAKHVSAWIRNNLYLALADAPFDREAPAQPIEYKRLYTVKGIQLTVN